jgi:type I restriction enzyme S subunit
MAGEWRETIYGPVARDFTEDKLRNLCDPEVGIQTGPFGSQLHQEDYVPVGTPIITVEHLGENRILHDGVPRVSDADRNRLSRYLLQTGDIVFSRVGSVDRRALVRPAEDGWMFSGRCLRVRPNLKKIDSGYLSYFFGLPAFKEHIRAIAVGATMPSLNTSLLSEVVIPHPKDIAEQRAIAHILATLDDKIELNRRMNETLEAMARALFKSWFIDFDPVRRNAARARNQPSPAASRHPLPLGEGRGERCVESFDALFPDSFEDSELGEIPKGWRVGVLGDVAEHPRRSVQPEEIEPTTPYIALEHMPRRCIALSEWDAADGLESNKFAFKRGEILFGKLRPYFHKVGVAPVDGVCSTDIVVVSPRTQEWFGFVLAHVSSDAFVEHTNAGSTGTKMPRTSWGDMARYVVVIPPENVTKAFTSHIQPAVDHVIASIHEARTLGTLRDTLLPRLISGEMRVPNVDHSLGVMAHEA